MDTSQMIHFIQKRLGLNDQEFQTIKENPKYQRLFKNALAASKYRLVAEVIESKGCHSGHIVGQKLIFDSAGNLLTRECPEKARDGKYALLSIWDPDGAVIVYDAETLKEIKRLPKNKPSGKYNVFNKTRYLEGTSH